MNRISAAALLAISTMAALPHTAQAAPSVALDSSVFVERVSDDGGNVVRSLERAQALRSGDRVVTVVTWYRLGGDGAFTLTNPVPRGVYYQGSADGSEQVSIDGGRSWGRIGELRLGNRFATVEDVTHVRWNVPAGQVASGRGRIAYAGIVR